MCSPGNKTPQKPELPPVPWHVDDPLAYIPTHLRPDADTDADLGHCNLCGHPASQDELQSYRGRHASWTDDEGNQHNNCPTHLPKKPKVFRRKSLDQPPIRVILAGPEQLKGPSF